MDFRANLSSLIKASLFNFESYTVSFLQGISINLERNAFKGEKSRKVSCDICQVWAILVSMSPSFPRYKEGTGGRGQIEPGPPVISHVL